MSVSLRFGKLRVRDSPIFTGSLNDLIEVKWTRDIPRKRGGIDKTLDEDFFVECGYDLLLALRPFADDDEQVIIINDRLLELINMTAEYCKRAEIKRKYKLSALWLKYWAKLAVEYYGDKASIISTYKCNSYRDQNLPLH